MSTLRICLFGSLRIWHNDRPEVTRVTRTVEGLLAYLLLHRQRTHSRSVLAGLFWGEETEQQARSCLKTALWRARRALESEDAPSGNYLVTTPTGEVGFNPLSNHWLDVDVFEQSVAAVATRAPSHLTPTDAAMLEQAAQIYTGDLLEGIYDDWTLAERERLRELYCRSLIALLGYYSADGRHDQALECGRKVLAVDPLREEIHRDVMRVYLESGQRALAARQYQTCRRVLADELAIEPMPETRALYAQVVAAAPPAASGFQINTNGDLQATLSQLRLALDGVDQVRQMLLQTLEQLQGRP